MVRERRMITLQKHSATGIAIKPQRLQNIFGNAFDRGLEALAQELRILIDIGRDFDILSLGGSISSPRAPPPERVESLMAYSILTAMEKRHKT